MSLQELDRSSGVIAEAKNSDSGKDSDNLSPRVQWFRRMCPHFFKPGIVEAREAEVDSRTKKTPVTWRAVARIDRGEHTHVSLHINLRDHTFRLVPINSVDGVGWPIAEATLLHATAQRSEWVTIVLCNKSSNRLNRLDRPSIQLHRGELLAAYNVLKSQV